MYRNRHISWTGIDYPEHELAELSSRGRASFDLFSDTASVKKDKFLFEGMMQARRNASGGCIMLCGALHAPFFIQMITEMKIKKEFIIAFPYTKKITQPMHPEMPNIIQKCETLWPGFYRELDQRDPSADKAFSTELIKKAIAMRTTAIGKTAASERLSELLHKDCELYFSPDSMLDATFEGRFTQTESDRLAGVAWSTFKRRLPTGEEKDMTIIRGINTEPVLYTLFPRKTASPN